MAVFTNILLQNSLNAIQLKGSNCYSSSNDINGKAAEKVIKKLALEKLSEEFVTYKYLVLSEGEFFNTDNDDVAFFASAPLTRTARGRRNTSAHFMGFTFSSSNDYNPAFLIDDYILLSGFESASESLNEEFINEFSGALESTVISYRASSGNTQFGDSTIDCSLNESSIFQRYRFLIINAIDTLINTNFEKRVALSLPYKDSSKVIRLVLTLLPRSIAKRISFATRLSSDDSNKYLLYCLEEGNKKYDESDIVINNTMNQPVSLFAKGLVGKTIAQLLSIDRESASKEFELSLDESRLRLHLEEVAAQPIQKDKNNWTSIFTYMTENFGSDDQNRCTVLANIVKAVLSSNDSLERRVFEYGFNEKKLSDFIYHRYTRNDSELITLALMNILTYSLPSSGSPAEVTYLSSLFSELMSHSDVRILLSDLAPVEQLGYALSANIMNLTSMAHSDDIDFSPFIKLIMIFSLGYLKNALSEEKTHYVDYVFPPIAQNYANASVSKALCELLSESDTDDGYRIIKLLCLNGFFVDMSMAEKDSSTICIEVKKIVEISANFANNISLYAELKTTGIEEKYYSWLLPYTVASFSTFSELSYSNDTCMGELLQQVHLQTTKFLHENPQEINFVNAPYLFGLYDQKYIDNLSSEDIPFEEEVKNRIYEVYQGKVIVDDANKDFMPGGAFYNEIDVFEKTFGSGRNKRRQGPKTSSRTRKQVVKDKNHQVHVTPTIISGLIAIALYAPIYLFGNSFFYYSIAFMIVFAVVNIVGTNKYASTSAKNARANLWTLNFFIVILPLVIFDGVLACYYFL